jgi:hypothetical protein
MEPHSVIGYCQGVATLINRTVAGTKNATKVKVVNKLFAKKFEHGILV